MGPGPGPGYVEMETRRAMQLWNGGEGVRARMQVGMSKGDRQAARILGHFRFCNEGVGSAVRGGLGQ